MDDLSIMNMLHPKTKLREHVEDVLLAKGTAALLLDFIAEVAPVGEVHDDAQLPFLSLKRLDEFDNIRVPKMLDDSCLLESDTALLLAHTANVDNLHHAHQLVGYSFDQIRLAKGAFTEQFYLFIMREFFAFFEVLH